jgi:hypothetical protein
VERTRVVGWPDLTGAMSDSSAAVRTVKKTVCMNTGLAGSQRRVCAATSLTKEGDGSVSLGVCAPLIFNRIFSTVTPSEICTRSQLRLSVSFVPKEVIKLLLIVYKLGRMVSCLYASYCTRISYN